MAKTTRKGKVVQADLIDEPISWTDDGSDPEVYPNDTYYKVRIRTSNPEAVQTLVLPPDLDPAPKVGDDMRITIEF